MAQKTNGQINLERLEFLVSYKCASRCDHCSVYAKEENPSSQHLDLKKALEAIEDSCDLFEIESLMTFGGEPLLYPEFTCAGQGPRPLQVHIARALPARNRGRPLALEGKRNKEIADALFVSENTVKTHMAKIFGKAGSRPARSSSPSSPEAAPCPIARPPHPV